MTSSVLQRIQEIYRTTYQGARFTGMNQAKTILLRFAATMPFSHKNSSGNRDAKERLKTKGAVPTKNGKPIFEGSGDLQSSAHVIQEALPVQSSDAVSGLDQDRVGFAGRPY